MKRRYRVGLTIQELEARYARAAEARRLNSLLVYPPAATLLRRKVAQGKIGGPLHASIFLNMLQAIGYPGIDERAVRAAYREAVELAHRMGLGDSPLSRVAAQAMAELEIARGAR